MIEKIHWLGHASFRIDGSKCIYIDPWKLANPIKADLIFVTHDHFDHLSITDIDRIKKPSSQIIAAASCRESLPEARIVRPGQKFEVDGIGVEVVYAYNKDKKFHPRSGDRAGYVITIDGKRIYHAGDTDHIPEMKDIRCDVALLPVSGTYVMTAEEAALAVSDLQCTHAVPMHWGEIIGSRNDAERFKKLASCETVILQPE